MPNRYLPLGLLASLGLSLSASAFAADSFKIDDLVVAATIPDAQRDPTLVSPQSINRYGLAMALRVPRSVTAVCATPLAGSEARLAPENACQMCLVGKAAGQSDLRERFQALEHFPASPLNTPVEDESVRRSPEGAFEGA